VTVGPWASDASAAGTIAIKRPTYGRTFAMPPNTAIASAFGTLNAFRRANRKTVTNAEVTSCPRMYPPTIVSRLIMTRERRMWCLRGMTAKSQPRTRRVEHQVQREKTALTLYATTSRMRVENESAIAANDPAMAS
jgi:hypothetical protein